MLAIKNALPSGRTVVGEQVAAVESAPRGGCVLFFMMFVFRLVCGSLRLIVRQIFSDHRAGAITGDFAVLFFARIAERRVPLIPFSGSFCSVVSIWAKGAA